MRSRSQFVIWWFCWAHFVESITTAGRPQYSCHYQQYVEPGRVYFLSSPGFPGYNSFHACQWETFTSAGSSISAHCYVLDVKGYDGPCTDYLRTATNGVTTTHCTPFTIVGDWLVKLSLKPSIRQSGRFQCTFVASEPIPTTPFYPTVEPSSDDSCNCGRNPRSARVRIVGGEESGVHEFPSMAVFIDMESRSLWCGGTIISPNAVLTAAHCTFKQDSDNYGVLIGEHDISKTYETSETSMVRVSRFITHPGYNNLTYGNDIAIAVTSEPMRFTGRVGPACLPFKFSTTAQSYTTATGWGLDSFGGASSNVLMKVKLKIIRPNFCVESYDYFSPLKQICTYSKGKDACQYDSGGPLYVNNDENKQLVVGVISHGKDCGMMYPAVNTRVASYLDWIQSALPSEKFCKKY